MFSVVLCLSGLVIITVMYTNRLYLLLKNAEKETVKVEYNSNEQAVVRK